MESSPDEESGVGEERDDPRRAFGVEKPAGQREAGEVGPHADEQVLESGQAGALWIIAIAPASMSGVLKTAQSKGVPVLINGVPADYGFSGPQKG